MRRKQASAPRRRRLRGSLLPVAAAAAIASFAAPPSLLPTLLPAATAHVVSSDSMSELSFRRKVDSALARVRTLLDQTRSPRIRPASSVDHSYDDKFALTEFLTDSAIAATVNVLDRVGLDRDELARLREEMLRQDQSVTLRFEAAENCTFVKEKVVEISGPTSETHETYETTATGESKKVEQKKKSTRVVREITEYHWDFHVEYTLRAYVGPDPEAEKVTSLLLRARSGTEPIVISGNKRRPVPPSRTPPWEVDLTWLLRQLDDDSAGDGGESSDPLLSRFRIDRDSETCLTPRRNACVEGGCAFFASLGRWAGQVSRYLQYDMPGRASIRLGKSHVAEEEDKPVDPSAAELLASVDDVGAFVPVLPILEEPGGAADDAADDANDRILSAGDAQLLLNEQCRSLDGLLSDVDAKFPPADGPRLATSAEARLILLARHASSISAQFHEGVDGVEGMLRSQLVAAIGKEVTPADFDGFVRSYYPKLLRREYVPEPFVYSIRRPHHYPDGTLAIESANDGGEGDASVPIMTTTKKVEGGAPLYVPINAATRVEFGGNRYLHAWVRNDFHGDVQPSGGGTNLVARARQFSSFLLVVGNIAGPDTFHPQHAIILQNKDEVLLPLLLEQLPTPKEFRDAIQSLSPEQRAFATAFRNMELESSVFGVLVIQLKPQLENVLGLPYDSLTKEIRLTQDLLSLFIEHQIPSDLLTYDGDEGSSVAEKIARVKTHVSSVQEMISDAKKKELEEAKMETDMRAEKRYQAKYANDQFGDTDELEEDPVNVKTMMQRPQQQQQRSRRLHAETGIRPQAMGMQAMESEPQMPQMMMAGMMAEKESFSESTPHLRKSAFPTSTTTQTEESPRFVQEDSGDGEGAFVGNSVDFTKIPKQLDAKFEALDRDSALQPTKIKTGDTWTKRCQKSLLTSLQTETVDKDGQKTERDKAFDLLDALSKSGALPIEYADLHVMVAATHRFDKSLIDTIIVGNVNPIEKIERSLLIVSSTINDVPVAEILNEARVPEIAKHSPALLEVEAPAFETKKGSDGDELESTSL